MQVMLAVTAPLLTHMTTDSAEAADWTIDDNDQ